MNKISLKTILIPGLVGALAGLVLSCLMSMVVPAHFSFEKSDNLVPINDTIYLIYGNATILACVGNENSYRIVSYPTSLSSISEQERNNGSIDTYINGNDLWIIRDREYRYHFYIPVGSVIWRFNK